MTIVYKMSETVEISSPAKSDEKGTRLDCHLMPCEIKYRGKSSVDELFSIHPKKEETDEPTASFRGYELMGKELTLPKGYKGVILHQGTNDDEKSAIKSSCGSITYWNWDKNPTANDSLHKTMDWFKISQAIHLDENK